MRAMVRMVMAVVLGGVVWGCTVGPKFVEPKVGVEAGFGEGGRAAGHGEQPVAAWWGTFGDAELDRLVGEALQSNLDFRMAGMRILAARAERNITAGELFPEVDASAGYDRARGSRNVKLPLGGATSGSGGTGSGAGGGAVQPFQSVGSGSTGSGGSSAGGGAAPLTPFGEGGLPGVTTSLYQAGFDANWELDIFGGHRKELAAAGAEMGAAVEERRGVAVTLLAEVARNYLEYRGGQARLGVARANLAAEKDILELTRSRRKQGFTTELDVARAAGEVATTAATIPPLEAQARRSVHALAMLLAKNPNELDGELAATAAIPVAPPRVPVGLPSDLLRRRPDIRKAELEIRAANARVGSATADLFPKFALTGSVGLDASKLAQLFRWDSGYFLVSPTVTWPVFDAGKIVSNISLQKVNEGEAVLAYRKAVLTALQEVEDALEAYSTEQVRDGSLLEALKQNRESMTIARMQYKQGLANYLEVLDAQRSVLATEDAEAQSREMMTTDLVALYKALGGGWEVAEGRSR